MAADQAARQHAISGDADAELTAGLQDVAFDAALDQRIFDLEIDDRMHGMRAADGVGADLGQADMPDIAGLHHLGDAADRLLDGNAGIKPCRPVDVDVVGAETLERIGKEVPRRSRPRIEPDEFAGGAAQRAELDAELNLVARTILQRLADQHFIVAHAVEIAGVEQRDAGIERRMDGGDALAAIGWPIGVRHGHAAEAEA